MPTQPSEFEIQHDEDARVCEAARIEGLVWVFQRSRGNFPSGVWSSKEKAENWIHQTQAEGTLSGYVLDESAYDSCVRLGHLNTDNPNRLTREFQRDFTTAVDHAHYPSPGND